MKPAHFSTFAASSIMPAMKLFEKRAQRGSFHLFFNQSKEYQESVIPSHLPVFGLTAGLPSSMYRLVGKNGVVWGLDHFGNSAPYKVLDEKFGFTTENVLHQVKMLLNK